MRLEGAGKEIRGTKWLGKKRWATPQNQITSDPPNPAALHFPYRVSEAPEFPQPMKPESWHSTSLSEVWPLHILRKKKKKKTIWEQCEGITRMGTHPSEEWRKLSRSFSSSLQKLLDFWVLNSHRLRNKQNVSWEGDASAVTTDQWATCLPHQCWSDRALTDGTRCGFSPRRYCFTVGWKYISQISWSKEKLHPREF